MKELSKRHLKWIENRKVEIILFIIKEIKSVFKSEGKTAGICVHALYYCDTIKKSSFTKRIMDYKFINDLNAFELFFPEEWKKLKALMKERECLYSWDIDNLDSRLEFLDAMLTKYSKKP